MESPLLRKTGLWLFACIALVAGWLLHGALPLVDESEHFRQIGYLTTGAWAPEVTDTAMPGYHLIMAALATVTGWTNINGPRFFTLMLSLLAVYTFWRSAEQLDPASSTTRSLQFAFLPILFPFFLLVYPESTSLLMVLASLFFMLSGRLLLGGVAGLLACVVQADNWLWLVFMIVLGHVSRAGWTLDGWQQTLRGYWLYALSSVAFAGFLIFSAIRLAFNSGGEELPGLYVGNIYFLLFVMFCLFAPTLLAQLPQVLPLTRRWQTWSRLSVAFAFFWFGFTPDHPFNTTGTDYFLRNGLLEFATSTAIWNLLFFVPIALTLLCLATLPLRRHWWLIYPATVLFLLPAWLVEQRYYVIPLSLFLLAHIPQSRRIEWLQLAWFIAMAAAIYFMIQGGHGFL